MSVHVFTSAAFNYIPKARLLFNSLRKHHPEWILHLALGDEMHREFDLAAEPFDTVLPIDKLDIPNWRAWAFCHTIVELCTAIKPFAMRRLLQEEDCEKVLYFDPDIVLFSRVDDILAALDESNILLTPHLTNPEERLDAVIDNEICSLRHGVYNLGFLGVRACDEARRIMDWWASRTYYFCRADIPNGLFTDQRWIDLVPAFFEGVAIMRNPRHNVATWNITTRNLTGNIDEGFFVDGEPLGFYHFTGFDSGAHLGMANRYAANSPSVFDLISWYDRRTEELGRDPIGRLRWAYDTYSDDEKITPAQRIVYRERVDLQAAFPDPFDAGGFRTWWYTHGVNEYPKLFGAQASAELLSSFSGLTPGFCGGVAATGRRSISQYWSSLRTSPRQTIRRGWEILRTEGITRFVRTRLSS